MLNPNIWPGLLECREAAGAELDSGDDVFVSRFINARL